MTTKPNLASRAVVFPLVCCTEPFTWLTTVGTVYSFHIKRCAQRETWRSFTVVRFLRPVPINSLGTSCQTVPPSAIAAFAVIIATRT